MQKSKGKFRKHGRKLKRPIRNKGISRYLQELKIGDRVGIDIDSSEHSAMPPPRFQGRTGQVKRKQGRAYVIKILDGHMPKTLIVSPAHLRK